MKCRWYDDKWKFCMNEDCPYYASNCPVTEYPQVCHYFIEQDKTLRKAIAIDFDGCICTNKYPEIGEPNWNVINKAKAEKRKGAGLILWTCREGDLLQEAIKACIEWGLLFDEFNDSLPDWKQAWGNNPRKVGATEYWDDRAVRMGGKDND